MKVEWSHLLSLPSLAPKDQPRFRGLRCVQDGEETLTSSPGSLFRDGKKRDHEDEVAKLLQDYYFDTCHTTHVKQWTT